MFQRVVTPLDGSEVAERALDHVIGLARLASVPIRLVRVVDLAALERYGAYGLAIEQSALESVLHDERREADAYLRRIAARIEAQGLPVTIERREGLAAREIVAATRPDDMLVIASHGRTGLKRWLLGSVAEDVLRHAACPVLLIRVDERAAPREDSAP